MSDIEKSRHQVMLRIDEALSAAKRAAGSCTLLAVSKTFPAQAVRECYATGQRAFGENYVQEMQEKSAQLHDLSGLEWHFIGPLQSNKSRTVAEIAAWVHTVDRLKIAQRLSDQRPPNLPPINVCVQVNVSGEASKSGCPPEDALSLMQAVANLPNIQLRGLMCIPEPSPDPQQTVAQFNVLHELMQAGKQAGLSLDTLSMGMSADLEQAIAAGSTIVRVGTAIFGARSYPSHP